MCAALDGFERTDHLRTLLTTLAIIVILALSAALVGPAFVDWSKHQSVLEAQLSRLLGQPVRVAGRIGLRLLPSPQLELNDVSVGPVADAPFTAKSVRLEMALTALLRGELLLTDAGISQPKVRVTRAANGDIAWPLGGMSKLGSVRIDKLAVRAGSLTVDDAIGGGSVTIDGIALDAEVSSLSGPYRGSGSVRTPAGQVRFRFSTAELGRRRMLAKLIVSEAAGLPRVTLDGALDVSTASPAFRGTAEFVGNGGKAPDSLPWKLSGAFEASTEHAGLSNFNLHVGGERRFMAATGSAELDYGATARLHASLAAKSIDIDRQFSGAEPGAVVTPRAALGALRQILDDAGVTNLPRLPLSLDFAVGLASLGGDALRDVTGSIAFTPGQPLTGKIAANAPGESRLTLDGSFDVGIAPKFQGRLALAAGDWPRFSAWAAQDDDRAIRALASFAPFHDVALTCGAEISSVGFALQDFVAKVDRSRFAGTLAYTASVGGERPRLSAYLTSDGLDVDRLPDVGSLAAGKGDLDLALDLVADAARVANVADTGVDAGRIELKLDRTAGSTVLDHLRIAGLGGATVQAHGRVDSRGSSFEGHLDAADLARFSKLVRHFLPEQIGDVVAARAEALSPAKLDVKLRASAAGEPENVAIDGTSGGTKVEASLDRGAAEHGEIVANLKLAADDSGRLLRQLGLATAVTGAGGGSVAITAKGLAGSPLAASMTAKLAGTVVAWHGTVDPSNSVVEGPATIHSADLTPLLRSLVVVAAGAPSVATDTSAELRIGRGRITLDGLKGLFAGAQIGGRLALSSDTAAAPGAAAMMALQVTGTLNVDKLALANLTGLVLGPGGAAAAGGGWSTQAFGAAPVALPETRLALRIATLDLGIGLGVTKGASLDVALKPGEMTLQLAPSAFRGGSIAVQSTLRHSRSGASLNGRFTLTGIGFNAPFARGRLDAGLEFAGTGDSPRALVAGLAGQGSLSLSDAQLSRLDAGAVDRIVAAVDAERLPLEPAALDGSLKRETARSGVAVHKLDFQVLLAAGIARLGPAILPTQRAEIELSGLFDLAASSIEVNEAMTLKATPTDWLGPRPRFTLIWSGPWTAPRRTLEASTFFNGLSARALTINLQKLEEFDAEVRERAFFNRRLKVIREHAAEERRAAEAKAAEAKAAEERRRRESERAAEARRLDEMLRANDLPPVGPPTLPPPPRATGPRPGG